MCVAKGGKRERRAHATEEFSCGERKGETNRGRGGKKPKRRANDSSFIHTHTHTHWLLQRRKRGGDSRGEKEDDSTYVERG